ncbi:hypothetical protein [Actinocrispum sp. NPDC049592]|uniref:hypothetical protein n=1 Tax=Actinocrispum sp. NPDC049592 TaxID=3154835 RepID=UPI003413AF63
MSRPVPRIRRPLRWLRLLGFARGPLRRRSDRAQKTLFAATTLMACLAIPVAADTAGAPTLDQLEITGGGSAGQRVPIWTNTDGTPVSDADRSTRWFGWAVKLVLAGVAWLAGVLVVYLLIAWLLLQRRISSWDKEWQRADHAWRRIPD